MKKLLVLISVTLANYSIAQISFERLEDDPSANPNTYLNLEWFGLEGNGTEDNDAGTGLYFGVSGLHWINQKTAAEGNLRVKYLNFEKTAGLPIHFESGLNYNLLSNTKLKNRKVVVQYNTEKYNATAYTYTGKPVPVEVTETEEQYFKTDFNVRNRLNGRAGLILHKDTYLKSGSFSNIGTGFLLTGIYGGIGYEIDSRFVAKVTEGNQKYLADATTYIRLYADAVFYPVISSDAKSRMEFTSPLGMRIGAHWYQPYRKGFFGKTYFIVEWGRRPVDKSYLNLGIGYNFIRK